MITCWKDPNTGMSDAPMDWSEECHACNRPAQEPCDHCVVTITHSPNWLCEQHRIVCAECRTGLHDAWCEDCARRTGAFIEVDGRWLCENCLPEDGS